MCVPSWNHSLRAMQVARIDTQIRKEATATEAFNISICITFRIVRFEQPKNAYNAASARCLDGNYEKLNNRYFSHWAVSSISINLEPPIIHRKRCMCIIS